MKAAVRSHQAPDIVICQSIIAIVGDDGKNVYHLVVSVEAEL
ncbi:MAG: hypothetical protein VX869_02645 [Chloroflexota bacterium]|nr:hypothetical protein [Chloroflexota bacterium]MEC9321058.1 hypothetical protein [Chloroflexota bacterium]